MELEFVWTLLETTELLVSRELVAVEPMARERQETVERQTKGLVDSPLGEHRQFGPRYARNLNQPFFAVVRGSADSRCLESVMTTYPERIPRQQVRWHRFGR